LIDAMIMINTPIKPSVHRMFYLCCDLQD
jgi:hypothetical protein